jgi:hypothetical protein
MKRRGYLTDADPDGKLILTKISRNDYRILSFDTTQTAYKTKTLETHGQLYFFIPKYCTYTVFTHTHGYKIWLWRNVVKATWDY